MVDLTELYKKLYELTEEQGKIIDDEDYDTLLMVLTKKRELMDEIESINIKEYLKKQRDPEKALEDLGKLMKKLKTLEDENAERMKDKFGDLKGKLRDINRKQRSRKGYQGNIKYDAKFIDKKG